MCVVHVGKSPRDGGLPTGAPTPTQCSVDPATAEQLGRTITALKGRATILFIAHMLPRSLQFDQIVRIGEKLAVVPSEKPEMAAQI